MKNQKLLSAVVAGLVSGAVVADEAPVKNAEEMVVTATRIEQPLHKVLASVSVVDRKAIENSTASNMAELLGRLPGVDFKSSGSRGSTSNIYVRGTNSDHVLILIDGVRSASATSGATALQQIPFDQVERVEVIRGPRASLYGADAIGGVIQVFTRRGEGQKGYITTEFGSNSLVKVSGGVSGGNESTNVGIGISSENTDGFDSTNKKGTVDDDDDGYEEKSIRLNIDHRFSNDWEVAASALRVKAETEYDSGSDSYYDSINQTLNVRLKAPLSDDLVVSINVSENRDESESTSSNPSVFDTKREMATVQVDYVLTEGNILSAGYDYYQDEVTSTTAFTFDAQDNKAYFLQYQGEVEHFLMTASFRSDDHESFGRNNTRTFAVGYPVTDNTLLSISYGTAFKSPTFNDLHYPYEEFNFGGGFIYKYSGNPEVQPERSESVEVMLRSDWQDISWYASYYETRVDDLIHLGKVGDVNTVVNVSKAKITGAELGADFSLLGWNSTLAITYTDPRDEDSDEMLSDRSRGMTSLAIDREFGDFEVAALWKAQSYRYNSQGTRLSGFNTVDLRTSYRLSEQFQLTAKMNNVFDVDYVLNRRDSSYGDTIYQVPGRILSVAVNYTF